MLIMTSAGLVVSALMPEPFLQGLLGLVLAAVPGFLGHGSSRPRAPPLK